MRGRGRGGDWAEGGLRGRGMRGVGEGEGADGEGAEEEERAITKRKRIKRRRAAWIQGEMFVVDVFITLLLMCS